MSADLKPIAHMVVWRLNGKDVDEKTAQGQMIVNAFERLRGNIKGLIRMEVGVNVIPAPDAWDVALSMVFSSRTELQEYLDHPSHLEIKKIVGPIRMDRGQADFELGSIF